MIKELIPSQFLLLFLIGRNNFFVFLFEYSISYSEFICILLYCFYYPIYKHSYSVIQQKKYIHISYI